MLKKPETNSRSVLLRWQIQLAGKESTQRNQARSLKKYGTKLKKEECGKEKYRRSPRP